MRAVLVALIALPLTGCAQQMMNAAHSECQAFGLSPGTTEYASCVQQQYAQRQAAFQQGMSNLQATGAQMQATPFASAPGIYKGEYISGHNKICRYNNVGSEVAITIGATDLCPR